MSGPVVVECSDRVVYSSTQITTKTAINEYVRSGCVTIARRTGAT
jgi:hypothetical protein